MRNHDLAFYNLRLQLIGGTTGRDLLAHLREHRTFLVDTNASWKPLAQQFSDVCFVIGCTLTEEADNIEGVLFSGMPDEGWPNGYAVDVSPNKYGLMVAINRLDSFYRRAVFSSPLPRLSDRLPEDREYQRLLSNAFRELVATQLRREGVELVAQLEAILPQCRSDYHRSQEAGVLATAIYLKSLPEAEQAEKLRPEYVNFVGDSRMIAEALFFGFEILSGDGDVRAMGRIVHLSVHQPDRLERHLQTPSNRRPA